MPRLSLVIAASLSVALTSPILAAPRPATGDPAASVHLVQDKGAAKAKEKGAKAAKERGGTKAKTADAVAKEKAAKRSAERSNKGGEVRGQERAGQVQGLQDSGRGAQQRSQAPGRTN